MTHPAAEHAHNKKRGHGRLLFAAALLLALPLGDGVVKSFAGKPAKGDIVAAYAVERAAPALDAEVSYTLRDGLDVLGEPVSAADAGHVQVLHLPWDEKSGGHAPFSLGVLPDHGSAQNPGGAFYGGGVFAVAYAGVPGVGRGAAQAAGPRAPNPSAPAHAGGVAGNTALPSAPGEPAVPSAPTESTTMPPERHATHAGAPGNGGPTASDAPVAVSGFTGPGAAHTGGPGNPQGGTHPQGDELLQPVDMHCWTDCMPNSIAPESAASVPAPGSAALLLLGAAALLALRRRSRVSFGAAA